MTVERALTNSEMADHETTAAQTVAIFVDAYIQYPTAENFDLVIQHMRNYQTAWMNGRQRP